MDSILASITADLAPETSLEEADKNLEYWIAEGETDTVDKLPEGMQLPDRAVIASAEKEDPLPGAHFTSVSGLSPQDCVKAVHMVQQAAVLAYHKRINVHYTQDALARWEAIRHNYRAWKGQYPREADCSSISTWYHTQWTYHFHHRDTINGQNFHAGYTGTLAVHGRRVVTPHPGDLVLYGSGWPYEHVACYTGGGLVVSHGGEIGPLLLPVHYRGDAAQYRRYI